MAARTFVSRTWQQTFNRRTSELMSSLRLRHKRKHLPPVPFELGELRARLLEVLGTPDGVQLCRYCRTPVDITTLACDHEIPLKRGGGFGLDNLGFPCQACNLRKGGLTPDEFFAYLRFRATLPPAAQTDLDNRLQIAVQLAAKQNWNRKKGH